LEIREALTTLGSSFEKNVVFDGSDALEVTAFTAGNVKSASCLREMDESGKSIVRVLRGMMKRLFAARLAAGGMLVAPAGGGSVCVSSIA